MGSFTAIGTAWDKMDKAGQTGTNVADTDVEKKLVEKDRDFKRVCQRYARMRSRSGK